MSKNEERLVTNTMTTRAYNTVILEKEEKKEAEQVPAIWLLYVAIIAFILGALTF